MEETVIIMRKSGMNEGRLTVCSLDGSLILHLSPLLLGEITA
jgi:hypothetical protein